MSINNSDCHDKECKICLEVIKKDRLVTLKCNENHTYCYDCIFDWFNSIKNNNNNIYDTKPFTCPYCKQDGGFLPLLPPHTQKIYNIHTNIHLCDCKDCNNEYNVNQEDSNILILNNFNILHVKFCETHQLLHNYGTDLILKNDILFKSPFIRCMCLISNNNQCVNAFTEINMNKINIENKIYFICQVHNKLYQNGAPIIFNDKITTQFNPIIKKLCCAPNKSKYGYCLNKLDFMGMCKTNYHNNNVGNIDIIKHLNISNQNISNINNNQNILSNEDTSDNSFINDLLNDFDNISISNNNNDNICNVLLKNKKGNCQNKGKIMYNGKCGVHKNC